MSTGAPTPRGISAVVWKHSPTPVAIAARVTITTLQPDEARRLADDIAAALGGRAITDAGRSTYAG
jgi:hypothetical protein